MTPGTPVILTLYAPRKIKRAVPKIAGNIKKGLSVWFGADRLGGSFVICFDRIGSAGVQKRFTVLHSRGIGAV
jgi:hypothetical protein